MVEVFTCFGFWLLAVIFETTVLTLPLWFQPNLFFLIATIFCLHWRGPEVYFIAFIFGLTADCFSSLPFGIYGLTYFTISFFTRWYSIKVFQQTKFTLPLVTGILTVVLNIFVLIILKTFFSVGEFTSWFKNILLNEIIPTSLLAVFAFRGLTFIEKRYKIHLSERNFWKKIL